MKSNQLKCIKKKVGRTDDVMKTPLNEDLRAPRLCNPPAIQLMLRRDIASEANWERLVLPDDHDLLLLWPAIDKGS